eukprot:TRINITY_DN2889_c0_g7_i1.p1 TRINITY_DN2889_c0_g7~~TRINITY_DN2889_c0_g7_i1.p1  ORF type:complete len:199 (-),score=51.51 TRINITY_DN2889_c0_g7_i1:822-1418(-)
MGLSMLLNGHSIWKEAETWENIVKEEIKIAKNRTLYRTGKETTNGIQPAAINSILRKVTANSIMLNMKRPILVETIEKWGKKGNLDGSVIEELVTDVKVHLPITTESIMRSCSSIRLKRRKDTIKHYRNSGMILGIAGSLKYFQDYKELMKVVLLNKEMKELLREKVYEQMLLRTNNDTSDAHRLELWKHLLSSVRRT